jgi:hypothetical protein
MLAGGPRFPTDFVRNTLGTNGEACALRNQEVSYIFAQTHKLQKLE